MKLYTVKSEELAHNSYFLCDDQEAAVIDPRRDCRIYLHLAQRLCVKIKYVLETHRNEDYVAGSLELQRAAGAQVCHSNKLDFKYGGQCLDDGETLQVGALKLTALHTPGHTDESLCYTVANTQKSPQPLMVFTGDTLFVGAVGRTDLQGKNAQPTQAQKLYQSIHEKLLGLGDGVLVYPAHGAGSVCGSQISQQPYSTIGYEKQTNPYLCLTQEQFVQKCLAQEMIVPAYFARCITITLWVLRRFVAWLCPKP
jgi:hydroxyacylglutathione hydrolase